MSYILEALRKSERQRRANEEPPVARLAAEPPKPAGRRRSIVVALSVLANVALLLYLATGVNPRKTPDTAARAGAQPVKAASDNALPQQGPAPDLAKRSPPVASPLGPDADARLPEKPGAASASLQAKASTLPPRARREPVRPPPAAASGSGSEPRLPRALPQRPSPAGLASERAATMGPRRQPAVEVDEFRSGKDFPRPKINVYAYSNRNDSDRFVIISNRKYREGDQIEDGGATVKRIEEHAMTLEYQGQTYKVQRP